MAVLQMITNGLYELWTSWGVFGVLVAACCCLLTVWLTRRPRNLPPGPWGWPVVGVAFSFKKAEPLVVTDWMKQYGDVITYYRGPELVVILNSYDAIREAFVKNAEVFSSRPKSLNPTSKFIGKAQGVAAAPYGPYFKEHRKFTLMSLRDFGVGKRSLEGKILEEAKALGDEIMKKGNKDFSIAAILQMSVSNVICSIVFGSRYEYDDPKFMELCEAIGQFFSIPRNALLPALIPILRYIPGVNRAYHELGNATFKILNHVREQVKSHETTFDQNDIRDFIDAFNLEKKRRETEENNTFTQDQNVQVVVELFVAGTETTSTTLRWALFYMILHPDIQDRVRQEIDSVIGLNQDPSMTHRNQMPYTEATLAEVGRLATISPFSVSRATSHETTLKGYTIPKGTTVHGNLWAIHHDPQLWSEPFKFDPARFLDHDGKFVKRDEAIPFSIGRRVCLGEQLARMELFLVFTLLLQRFTFKLPEGAPVPSEEGVFGATHSPVPHKLVAVPRN